MDYNFYLGPGKLRPENYEQWVWLAAILYYKMDQEKRGIAIRFVETPVFKINDNN